MANKSHLFEDLRLNKDKGQVNGISNGLAIAGEGTFKFIVKDDEGKKHTICIKNSLYIPKNEEVHPVAPLWAQEAGDKQTWMKLKRQWPYDCVLNWKGGKKQFPTDRQPMCWYSTLLHLQCAIAHLPQPLRQWRPLSSNERRSSNFLVTMT